VASRRYSPSVWSAWLPRRPIQACASAARPRPRARPPSKLVATCVTEG
jgi:hypothetical protein